MRNRSVNLLRVFSSRWGLKNYNSGRTSHQASMSSQVPSSLISESNEVRSPFPSVAPSKKDITTLILETAKNFSHHTAVECGLTGLKYSYGQLLDRCLRWASHLQSIGVGKGDVVAVFMPNTAHYPLACVGSAASSASFTLINSAFTPNEVKTQLEDSSAKVIIVDPHMESIAEKAVSDMANPPLVYVTGPSTSSRPNLLEIAEDKNVPFFDYKEFTPNDICCLQYSSGTTGIPKGAVVKHESVSSHLPMMHHPDIYPNRRATGKTQDVMIGLLPFFHAYGLYVLLTSGLIFGAKLVTLPQFKPDLFIALHKKHKVEVAHLVPPILQFLATHPLVKPDDLTYLRVAMCTAAPCPEDAARALKAKAPNPVFFQEGYGMTETFPTNYTPLTGPEKIGSCGPLLPNVRAKVIELDTGKALGPGEAGELCVKTPGLMHEYHNRPDATAEIYTNDGWLRTGDMAEYDNDGYFYIVDRLKELIKVKGAQVSPSELENLLLQHSGVGDVGIVGVEDIRSGELPRAYVVKRNPDLTEEEVINYLEDKVASYKQLKGGVKFVQQLPKNLAGKLIRKDLKQWAAQGQ